LQLWKLELQKLANETGLSLSVCHFPPGTSKWNKVEHRLFSFISSNWRGEPLRDYESIVNLMAQTTTVKGLKVTCRLDHRKYPTGKKITAEEMKGINLERAKFHGEWNYTIHPTLGRRNSLSRSKKAMQALELCSPLTPCFMKFAQCNLPRAQRPKPEILIMYSDIIPNPSL